MGEGQIIAIHEWKIICSDHLHSENYMPSFLYKKTHNTKSKCDLETSQYEDVEVNQRYFFTKITFLLMVHSRPVWCQPTNGRLSQWQSSEQIHRWIYWYQGHVDTKSKVATNVCSFDCWWLSCDGYLDLSVWIWGRNAIWIFKDLDYWWSACGGRYLNLPVLQFAFEDEWREMILNDNNIWQLLIYLVCWWWWHLQPLLGRLRRSWCSWCCVWQIFVIRAWVWIWKKVSLVRRLEFPATVWEKGEARLGEL